MLENIGSLLTRQANRSRGLEAVVSVEQGLRITYLELNRRANEIASGMLAKGITKGERVAFLLMNGIEFVEAYFAAAKIGAVVVPLNWRLTPDELEFIVKDSGSSALIYGSELDGTVNLLYQRTTPVRMWIRVGESNSRPRFAENYETALRRTSATEPDITTADDDLLFIMYTSGTTGFPKGVMHTHETMLWASLTWNMTIDMRHRDRQLIVLPLFHIGGLSPLTAAFHRGQTVVLMRSAEAEAIIQTIAREKITITHIVTTILRRLLLVSPSDQHNCSTLRWIIAGGEAVSPDLIRRGAEVGIEVLQDYGLTEACGPATIISSEDAIRKAGSSGQADIHTEVRVVDKAGRQVEMEEIGELLVRGRHVMKGYWNLPKATAEAIRDGWLYTGDLATMDKDGCIYIRDRKKDMIVSGGENIYPAELERVLQAHPKVKEVAVIGQPSEKWGESPAAILVTKEDENLSADEVIAYCRGKLAGYKVPRRVEFVREIPRTPSGKIQKHLLRKQFPGPAPQ